MWRVGHNPDPLAVTAPKASELRSKRAGHRFAIPRVGVLYMATKLEGCFAETLAPFRPHAALAAMVEDEWRAAGHLRPGTVNAGWRHRRTAVRVHIDRAYEFLDVEELATHQVLTVELAAELDKINCREIDVGAVRGPDRRVTRLIARWAYDAVTIEREMPALVSVTRRFGLRVF